MPPRQIVIFDIDGTLTDTTTLDDANIARAFRELFGLEIDVDWSRYRTSTDSGIAREILETARGVAPGAAELESLTTRLVHLLAEGHAREPVRPMPGVVEALAALEQAGFALSLASGGWKRTAEAKLAAAGLNLAHLPRAAAAAGAAQAGPPAPDDDVLGAPLCGDSHPAQRHGAEPQCA